MTAPKEECMAKHIKMVVGFLGVLIVIGSFFVYEATRIIDASSSRTEMMVNRVDGKLDGSIAERKAILNAHEERIRILETAMARREVQYDEIKNQLARIEKIMLDHYTINK